MLRKERSYQKNYLILEKNKKNYPVKNERGV